MRTAWRFGLGIVALLVLATLYGLAKPGLSGHGGPPTNRRLTIGITQEFESLNPLIGQMSATFYLYSMVNRKRMDIVLYLEPIPLGARNRRHGRCG